MNSTESEEIVATVVAGMSGQLSVVHISAAVTLLEKAGGASIRTNWLAKDIAADIFCANLASQSLRDILNRHFENHPIDILVQPVAARRKKLLVADMESTIIQQEMLDEIAADLGFGEETAAITRRSMNGEIDFADSLRERVALLKGRPLSVLAHAAERITFMPGAEALLSTMKGNGAACWLVTGGFDYFAEPVAKRLGFDKVFANTLVVRDGLLTGEVTDPILDRNGKKNALETACKELGLSLQESLAVGDGANDLAMLSTCNEGGGLGVAYHAKPAVRAAVPHQINYGDLTALLYAQGYCL